MQVLLATWVWPGITMFGGIVPAARTGRLNILSAYIVGFFAFSFLGAGIQLLAPYMASRDGADIFNELGNGQLVTKQMAKGFSTVWKSTLTIIGGMWVVFHALNILSFYALVSGALKPTVEGQNILLPSPELSSPTGVAMFVAHVAFGMMINLVGVYLVYLPSTIALAATSMKDSLIAIMNSIEKLPRYNLKDPTEWDTAFEKSVVKNIRTFALNRLPKMEQVFAKTIMCFIAGLFMFGYCFIVYAIDERYVQRSAIIVFAGHESFAMGNVAHTLMHITFIAFSLAFFFIPFLLVKSLANVTSRCEEIRKALNELRLRDLNVDLRILALERAMNNMHNGAGMGFKLFGTLVDTATLKKLLSQMMALTVFGLPFVLDLKKQAETTATL